MEKKFFVPIVFFVFLTFMLPTVHAEYGNCTNSTSGSAGFPTLGDNVNWRITGNVVCQGVWLNISGNVTVASGATLVIGDSNIIFNITSTSLNYLEVFGTLNIDNNTNVSSNRSDYGFSFYYYAGSSGWINSSNLTYLHNNSGSNGLYIGSTGFTTIFKSFIISPLGYALNISVGSPSVNNTTITTTNGGIFIGNGSSPLISNSSITNTTGVGFNITNSNPTITWTIINGSALDAIFLNNSNATIFNNTISNSSRNGIFIINSNPSIKNNTIKLSDQAAINISATNASSSFIIANNSNIMNNTYGIAFFASTLTGTQVYNNTLTNNTIAIIAQNSSKAWVVDTVLLETRQGQNHLIQVNSTSNLTLLNITYGAIPLVPGNITFGGDATSNFTIKFYVSFYVFDNFNNPVREATISMNNSTTDWYAVTNENGTIPRINLTAYFNSSDATVLNINFTNYTYNATKGIVINSSNLILLDRNRVDSLNISIQMQNLITLTGIVNGTGNASGTGAATAFRVQGAVLVFNSTFNATTNGVGNYTVALPNGSYSTTITALNYTNSSTFTTTLNLSTTTLNLTMLPKIILIPKYYSTTLVINNGTFFNKTDQSLPSTTQYRIAGNATYAHNNASVGGTLYFIGTSGGYNDITQTTTTFTEATNGGNFSIDKTAPTPSTAATANYTVTLWVNDSYGSNGTATDWLQVTVTNGTSSSSSSSSQTGSPSGSTSEYSLAFTMYDKKITLAQGETKTYEVTAKNSGAKALEDVRLSLLGINDEWFKINVSGTGASTEDLSSGESVTYSVKFTIPGSATPKVYTGTWRVKDASSLAVAEKQVNITITKVWNDTTITTLNSTITNLKNNVSNVYALIAVLKKSKGANISSLEAKLAAFNASVQNAISKFNAGEYTEAQTFVDEANALLADLESSINALIPKGLAAILAGETSRNAALIIIVVAISAFAGFIIWYKFFRIITIAEIKKEPHLFAEGARIEGVVKSITDTKKGKVFLIADHTDKLYVRYPYYTTTERGDLVRTSGQVKTYKDVPYMDASDLHRVTLKH